jgi:hypothetical protein
MLLLLAVLAGTQGLQASAEVDRERLAVGDALTYTVRVVLVGKAPVRTFLPTFNGFLVVGRAERRDSLPALPVTLVMEFQLRAEQVGRWMIGGVRVEQGGQVVLSPEMLVEVTSTGGRAAPVLSPRVTAVLDRARSPVRGDVAVSLLASGDSVVVGEQLDLITVAWFPRQLLSQLRRPPELRPPTIAGVFNAVQPSVAGIGASRLVDGVWYDLYVAHQVVFPLTAGRIDVPPAGLAFAVPQGRQYFSEEKSYRLESGPLTIAVMSPPEGGLLGGPSGARLALGYELTPDPAVAGEPIPVTLVLSGIGNVALWPPPVVDWPDGARGYPDRPQDLIRQPGGVIQGEKRFRFSVLADSAGSLVLPRVRYPYYDLAAGRWDEAIAEPMVLPVQPSDASGDRRSTVALMIREPSASAGLGFPGAAWPVLLFVLPPLGYLLLTFRRRAGRRASPRRTGGSAHQRLRGLVHRLVPEEHRWRPDRIAETLREVGTPEELSGQAADLYLDDSTGRYRPGGESAEAEIERRARDLLGRWPSRLLPLLLLASLSSPTGAQLQPSESPLKVETPSAMNWYNEGAEAFMTRRDAQAAAAWVQALRLAPRDPAIRSAWQMIALRAPDLERWGQAVPVTATELLLIGLLGWGAGWALLSSGRRRLAGVAFAVALAFSLGAWGVQQWYRQPIAVVIRQTTLRVAPFGLAETAGQVEELAVVRVIGSRAGWRMIRLPSGLVGWTPAQTLAESTRLDSGA